jgi:hypothetical protein
VPSSENRHKGIATNSAVQGAETEQFKSSWANMLCSALSAT